MAQPTRHPVAFHRRTDRLGDNQPDARPRAVALARPPNMNYDVGLHRAHPVLHRRVELGGPPHAVACGKHRQKPCRQKSGSYCATALAAPVGHDGTSGSGTHPQAEPVHTGSAPIIRLEGPLALGHGILLVVSRIAIRQLTFVKWVSSWAGRKVVLLLAGAVPSTTILGRSRIADFRATV
jgi:hypothetical protein